MTYRIVELTPNEEEGGANKRTIRNGLCNPFYAKKLARMMTIEAERHGGYDTCYDVIRNGDDRLIIIPERDCQQDLHCLDYYLNRTIPRPDIAWDGDEGDSLPW